MLCYTKDNRMIICYVPDGELSSNILDNCIELAETNISSECIASPVIICAEVNPFLTEEIHRLCQLLHKILQEFTQIPSPLALIMTQYCTLIESDDRKVILKYLNAL